MTSTPVRDQAGDHLITPQSSALLLNRLPAEDREALAAVLGDTDEATLVRVRTYERKFQNRAEMLDPVADALRAHRLAVGNA